jgi:hypothetical protein
MTNYMRGLYGLVLAAIVAGIPVLAQTDVIHWTDGQVVVATTFAGVALTLGFAIAAHLNQGTKKEPVAIAGAVTAFTASLIQVAIAFAWVDWTQAAQRSVQALVVSLVAIASFVAARGSVTADTTPPLNG